MQVSFLIPTHHNPEGLYLTMFAALEQLEKSNLEWEVVICADGGTEIKWEQAHPNVRCFRYGGGNALGSPQACRDKGIRHCKFRNVLSVDSHVIVSDIARWVSEHERLGAAISFPSMVGTSSEMFKIYGNKMDWEGNFWNVLTFAQPKNNSYEPFMVCQCAHSGFMVDRDWYVASGGYTMEQKGYGGEEPWLALLAWMMGRQVWFIPSVWHAHYMPAGRNDGAGATDNFARNFLLCAYVMGGRKYLDLVSSTFRKSLAITPAIQELRNKVCSGPFHGDLDLLREYFKREGVVN